MKRVRTVAVAAAALLSAPFDAHGQASTTPTTTAVAVPPGATVFSPVPPCRLLDTRSSQALRANETVQTMAHGRCAVPATATAVAVTLTAVGPQAGGHLTLHPEQQRPDASHLNVMAGDIRANGALIQLGRDGQLRVTSSVPTHVLIDVSGYFTPVDGPATAGRFVPLTPRRVTDTRSGPVPTPRSSVRVNPNVPAGAIAVAVNITTDNAQAGDYFTAYPAGAARPTASVLNVDGAGRTRAAGVVVPLAGGAFDVYTHHGSHVIVDVTGYVTGATSEPSVDGLFVPTEPRRLIDTRQAEQGPRLYARATRDVTTTPVVAGQAAAIAANVTITDTFGTGWWLTHAAGAPPATPVSTLNVDAQLADVANMAIVPVSNRGIGLYAHTTADVIVDINGWFTGPPVTTTTQHNVGRHVAIVSDSAMAGVRWNGALGGLRGFYADHRLESCRRLVAPSCRGRERFTPPTALEEIRSMARPPVDALLVIATGYNDWESRFSSDFDTIVAAGRAKGFAHIAWVTYRSETTYNLPPGSAIPTATYATMNSILRAKVARPEFAAVMLWDLDRYTRDAPGWFAADGVHETRLGSWGVADWLSRHVAAFDGRPCPTPWTPTAPLATRCPHPDSLPATLGLPAIAALYGVG